MKKRKKPLSNMVLIEANMMVHVRQHDVVVQKERDRAMTYRIVSSRSSSFTYIHTYICQLWRELINTLRINILTEEVSFAFKIFFFKEESIVFLSNLEIGGKHMFSTACPPIDLPKSKKSIAY